MNHNYIAIMAGGVGSRFWPASREDKPKQFLDIVGCGKSLLQLTYERFINLVPKENILIVTNGKYKAQIKEHLPEVKDENILCEPSRNNTAPAVAYTAFKLYQRDPQANFVMAPSDHIILQETKFLEYISKSLTFTAENDALMTLGIEPTRPDTGYGYIESMFGKDEILRVERFVEKPNKEVAQSYLDAGNYLWNAGIFIWKAKSLIDAFKTHEPEIFNLFEKGKAFYNTNKEQAFIDENYPLSKSISIDYAILEKAKNIFTLPATFGWSDLGTWASLHSYSEKDKDENVVVGGNTVLKDCKNNLVKSETDKFVLLRGLEDFIVIDEEDVLMVYPKSKEQEIKAERKTINEKYL